MDILDDRIRPRASLTDPGYSSGDEEEATVLSNGKSVCTCSALFHRSVYKIYDYFNGTLWVYFNGSMIHILMHYLWYFSDMGTCTYYIDGTL